MTRAKSYTIHLGRISKAKMDIELFGECIGAKNVLSIPRIGEHYPVCVQGTNVNDEDETGKDVMHRCR